MNVLLAPQITEEIRKRYLLLELDSFRTSPETDIVMAYALIEHLPMTEMLAMKQYIDLHGNLMNNYRTQNWNYVEQAIEHLRGRWDCQLDSFYSDLLDRVKRLQEQKLDNSWDGAIDKY